MDFSPDTETLIGQWNGKPLYRKYYSVSKANSTFVRLESGTSIDEVVNYYGFMSSVGGDKYAIPGNIASTYNYVEITNGYLNYCSPNDNWSNGTIHITVEYTKTS